jgi:hypothetical protein
VEREREDFAASGLYQAGNNLLQQVHIAIIRLDDKVDNLSTSVNNKVDNLSNRVSELKISFDSRYQDQEARIRHLESRPYVAPATVWKVVSLVCTLATIGLGVLAATR